MDRSLRILFIEDVEDDAELVVREITRHGYRVDFERVETRAAMQAALAHSDWDLIICDYSLPQFDAPGALNVLKDCGDDTPFIITSGSISEETAVQALQAGAYDFILKGEPARLTLSMERALNETRERHERKRAEETLRESEQKFAVVFQKAPFATALSTFPEGIIVDVNEVFEKVFGYTRQEAIGKTSLELGINPDEEARGRILAGLQTQSSARDIEITLKPHTGAPRIFSVNLDVVGIGRQKYILQTAQDITERKQANQALREWEDRFRKVLDNMLEGFQIIGFDWRYLYVNETVASQGHRSREELEGRTMMEMYPGIEHTPLFTALQRCMGQRISQSMENEFAYPDGSTAWFQLVIQPAPDGIFILSTDITGRKRAEREILRLNLELEGRVLERTAELAAANKELEAFSYSVSHDLRAPLRGIDGFSKALLRDVGSELTPEARHYLDRILENTRRMEELIESLLELSYVTRRELKREPVDLEKLVREIAAELHAQEPAREAEFVIAEQARAQADPHLIKIALQNLIANAWKFTAPRKPARIEFGIAAHEGSAAFYVRDNGVGFDMARATKLFGAFQRMHSFEEFPGTGIGLATVQRIIHRHRGSVWAEAEVDRGATFYFTLGTDAFLPDHTATP